MVGANGGADGSGAAIGVGGAIGRGAGSGIGPIDYAERNAQPDSDDDRQDAPAGRLALRRLNDGFLFAVFANVPFNIGAHKLSNVTSPDNNRFTCSSAVCSNNAPSSSTPSA